MLAYVQYGLGAAVAGSVAYIAYNRFRPLAQAQESDIAGLEKMIQSSKVLVLSKSYCPYCTKTKSLLESLKATGIHIVELDQRADGEAIQSAA